MNVEGRPPEHAEIDRFMKSLGFSLRRHRFGDCWFRSEDRLLAFDVEPGNLVDVGDGLVPVDQILQKSPLDPSEVSEVCRASCKSALSCRPWSRGQ